MGFISEPSTPRGYAVVNEERTSISTGDILLTGSVRNPGSVDRECVFDETPIQVGAELPSSYSLSKVTLSVDETRCAVVVDEVIFQEEISVSEDYSDILSGDDGGLFDDSTAPMAPVTSWHPSPSGVAYASTPYNIYSVAIWSEPILGVHLIRTKSFIKYVPAGTGWTIQQKTQTCHDDVWWWATRRCTKQTPFESTYQYSVQTEGEYDMTGLPPAHPVLSAIDLSDYQDVITSSTAVVQPNNLYSSICSYSPLSSLNFSCFGLRSTW